MSDFDDDDDIDENEQDEQEEKDFQNDDDNLIGRKEAAKLLKVTLRTVIELEKNGYLTPRKKEQGAKAPIYYEYNEVQELRSARMKGPDAGPIKGNAADLSDAVMNMALAPSAIIRAFAKSMEVAQNHVVEMMAPVTNATKMVIELQMKENRRQTERIEKLENEVFEFIDLQKRALREDHEGKLVEITELEALKMKREAFQRLSGYFPLLATLIGNKLNPGQRATVRESALVDIIDKMDVEQLEVLQKSGVFGQGEMATIITMKERLEIERADRLRKEAESAQAEEETFNE